MTQEHREIAAQAEKTRQFLIGHQWLNTHCGVIWVPVGQVVPANPVGVRTASTSGHWFDR